MNPEDIARVAHEANRACCQALGEPGQPPWDEAPDWQRRSALQGVAFQLAHPGASAKDTHDAWMREKLAAGWTLGPVKDAQRKQHPCLVRYEDLPAGQQLKDALFRAVVQALAPGAPADPGPTTSR